GHCVRPLGDPAHAGVRGRWWSGPDPAARPGRDGSRSRTGGARRGARGDERDQVAPRSSFRPGPGRASAPVPGRRHHAAPLRRGHCAAAGGGRAPTRPATGDRMIRPILVVTAVAAERDAVLAGLPSGHPGITVIAAGVGPAAAAAGTARALALAEASGHPYRTVISAGVAGGFPGRAAVGATVLASRSRQADLGADSPDGFLPLERLGLGSAAVAADPVVLAALRVALPDAITGEVLTVATVTGTAERA